MYRHRMLLLIMPVIVLIFVAPISAENEYYYFKGGQIPIMVDTNSIYIQFKGLSPDQAAPIVTGSYPQLTYDSSDQQYIESFGLFGLPDTTDYLSIIDDLRRESYISVISPVAFVNETHTFIGATIVCKYLPGISQLEIDSLLEFYDLEVVTSDICGADAYLLAVTSSSPSVIDMANILYEQGYAEYSHPNFYSVIIPDSYTIQDEYYLANQWNVQKVAGLPGYPNAAWEISTGDPSIFVSVIDQGIEPHEDFDTTKFSWGVDLLLTYVDRFPVPQDICEYHGMACAGLICAQHNNPLPFELPGDEFASSAGLAPNCGMISERILSVDYSYISDTAVAASFYFARMEAGVINCSWSIVGYPTDLIDEAIDRTIAESRDGLGAVIVFSAGNFSWWSGYNILWPKNKDNVLAVGALNYNDSLFSYSCYGSTLDLVAPSGSGFSNTDYDDGILTTDRMSDLGITPTSNDCIENYTGPDCSDMDYNCGFGGTSAAAPLVTGTAALIMSRRPDLTAEQVIEVLKNSAVKDLDWGTITPELEDKYGAGRVNAFRALMAVWRGDVNNDGDRNIGDAVYMIEYMFRGGPEPLPHIATADVNNDALINIGDVVYLICHIFKDGPAPELNYHYDYES